MAFSVIINVDVLRLPNFLIDEGIPDLKSMAFSGIVSSKNMMEKKIDDLSSRTDLGDYFPSLSSSSDQCGNNRLHRTPNRANARLCAREAGALAAT